MCFTSSFNSDDCRSDFISPEFESLGALSHSRMQGEKGAAKLELLTAGLHADHGADLSPEKWAIRLAVSTKIE